jgi:hypothetical protein
MAIGAVICSSVLRGPEEAVRLGCIGRDGQRPFTTNGPARSRRTGPTFDIPDPKDRHVVAAAIQGKADLIVTINLKDFPAEVLAPYNLEAQHPDDFIMTLAESDPVGVLETIAEMQLSLQKPPVTTEELLHVLRRDDLPRVARWIPEAIQREKQEMEAIQRELDELGKEDQ